MTDTAPVIPSPMASRVEQVFPALTPAQIARIAAHGQVRPVQGGELLQEAGEQAERFFVVTAGRVEMVRLSDGIEELVAGLPAGHFTGEVNMLSGRRRLLRVRAAEPGERQPVHRTSISTVTTVSRRCWTVSTWPPRTCRW